MYWLFLLEELQDSYPLNDHWMDDLFGANEILKQTK